ncbi:Gluconolactonase [Cesiribacter andamanensis AMV16]|uniref:Gluconolactonase n=2 Tax=Cesiribacter TaxID=1133570 RepID=M7N2X3_9BACT|nr:Gluconolactonase [Cesiribacter andamanensis AMV16]
MGCVGQKYPTLRKAFEIKEKDLIPEGIAYDAQTDQFFVGSINKKKILQLSARGKAEEFSNSGSWGDFGYLGLHIDAGRRLLWACRYQPNTNTDSAGWGSLYKISLDTGRPLKKYYLPKTEEVSHLFNDLQLIGDELYLTDSEAGALLWLNSATDSLEYLLPPGTFVYPNGITPSPDGQALVVATAGGLYRVNYSSKEATPIETPDYYIIGVDGLYTHGGALIGLQSVFMPETISKFTLDGSGKVVEKIQVLANNHPDFDKITTGAIRRGWLYFIANSFVSELDEEGQVKNEEKLKNLLVYRLKLE